MRKSGESLGITPELYADSGIKVLDRSILILRVIAQRPANLSELCAVTSLPRATAHRLATALESHRLLQRDLNGRWEPGPALAELNPGSSQRIIQAGIPVMRALMEATSESVQLYRLTGTVRTCIASMEPPTGLQNTVPVGARMSLLAGSAAQVLMAFAPDSVSAPILADAAYTESDLERIRRDRIAESIGERDPSLASVTVPIADGGRNVIAALSISGPVERLRPSPIERYGSLIIASGKDLEASLV